MAYRGLTAPLPAGLMGLHGSKNPSQLSAAHLGYVEGVDVDGGLIRKDGGAENFNNAEFNASVISGTSWSPAADVYNDIIFLSSGVVRKDIGAGDFPITLASGLLTTLEPPPVFVPGGGESVGASRKLFMFSALNQVKYVAGIADLLSTIANPPADWTSSFPTFGVQHALRMWAGGNASDPHRIYYTTIGIHSDWAGLGTLPIYPGEGERLVAGCSFNGVLILWKYPLGVYAVDTRDPSPANWSVGKVSTSVGGLNQQTILYIDSDVMYLDNAANVHLLTATNKIGDVNTSNLSQISDFGKFARDNISLTRLRRACGIWYPNRRTAWYFVPQKASFENNLRIVVDRSDPTIGTRFLLSRRDTISSAWMRTDTDNVLKPVGGEGGFVLRMDLEPRNKNGEAYTMEFETASTDFGYLGEEFRFKNKNGEFLEIVSDLHTTALLEVEVYWDDILVDTINFDIGAEGAALDDFVLDTDVLAAAGTKALRRRLPGSGKRLKLRFRNIGADEDVGISAIFVSFALEDESTGR